MPKRCTQLAQALNRDHVEQAYKRTNAGLKQTRIEFLA